MEIDGISCEIIKALNCSVIQGSKLSALLYVIYIKEIPLLDKLMIGDLYKKITNLNLRDNYGDHIKHYICNYVDDSSNIISSKNVQKLQNYINDFFKLLEDFYNINKLTINSEKSKLLISCRNKLRENANKITLKASEYTIK